MKITRRQLIGSSTAIALSGSTAIASQARDLPDLEPVSADEYTDIDSEGMSEYKGEDAAQILRLSPADLEGMSFTVRGTIRHRWIGEKDYGYPAGYEGDVFRSLIWVTLDKSKSDAFLATNSDLAAIEDLKTFEATGYYSGIYDFITNEYNLNQVPLILVTEIGPANP